MTWGRTQSTPVQDPRIGPSLTQGFFFAGPGFWSFAFPLNGRWRRLRHSGPGRACAIRCAVGARLGRRDGHSTASGPSAPGAPGSSIYFTGGRRPPGGGLKLWRDASPDRSAKHRWEMRRQGARSWGRPRNCQSGAAIISFKMVLFYGCPLKQRHWRNRKSGTRQQTPRGGESELSI